jgi:LysR family transcriptional regulator, regulator for bpeEF and oprC
VNDPFAGVLPFVYVAEEQSFRRAAERLAVTPAAISKAIARLEDELGVVLLHRSTRRVDLSDEGVAYLERCREALRQVRAGRDELAARTSAITGELRVTMSPALARVVAAPVGEFVAQHPSVRVHLHLSDRMSRLIDEHLDVAVRIGRLDDSSLVARKLMETRWVTVAAPAYLARRGTPQTPAELANHECIKFRSARGTCLEWTFRRSPRGPASVLRTDGNLDADSGEAILAATLAGAGICQAMDFMVADALRDGTLVEILASHAAAGPSVHTLRLKGRRPAARVRAFVSHLIRALGQAR